MVFIKSETPSGRLEREGIEYADASAGYPEGVTPRQMVTRQGLLVERDGELVQVLDPVEEGPFRLYPGESSFNEVIENMTLITEDRQLTLASRQASGWSPC